MFFLSNKLTIISFILIILTYSVFGWISAASGQTLLEGGMIIFILCLLLITPIKLTQQFFSSSLQSDLSAFIAILVSSFLSVVVLTWIDVFAQFFVLISAGMLVRFDLRNAGYPDWKSFLIISGICITSFFCGVFLRRITDFSTTENYYSLLLLRI